MKIYAPVQDTNGVHASVRFVNGVGETDDPHLINWFKTHGYTVEESPKTFETHDESEFVNINTILDDDDEMMGYTERKPNFEDMTPLELRDWAKANGYGGLIKNTRNKEKLIEILRG